MQERDTCKLLCCLSGKPFPTVKWYKDKRELSKYEYSMTASDGVITMEIVGCRPSDSGKYSCIATNIHGTDETSCVVIVEGEASTEEQTKLAQKLLYSGDRKYIEQHIKPAPVPVTIKKPVPVTTNPISHPLTSSSSSNNLSRSSSNLRVGDADKRSPRKYGRLDSTGSPNRSRSATKELTRRFFTPFCLEHGFINYNFNLVPPDDSSMYKPQFTKTLSDLTVNDGDSFTLTAHVAGDPDPQVVWLKNNKPLSSSEVVDLKYKNGIAKLHINEVYPEDEGEYVCKATNSIGTEQTKCRLTIKRKCFLLNKPVLCINVVGSL